jgi:hypothetical protein
VSNTQGSLAWFEKLGGKKGWDWGDPACFGVSQLRGALAHGGPDPRIERRPSLFLSDSSADPTSPWFRVGRSDSLDVAKLN